MAPLALAASLKVERLQLSVAVVVVEVSAVVAAVVKV